MSRGDRSATTAPSGGSEWFERPNAARGRDGAGLRFSCTMCGHCCSGPEGYVLVSEQEVEGLAARIGLSTDEFMRQYTRQTSEGRSLIEKPAPDGVGRDCVFLDREKIPGKAVCGVYEDRPIQCRTWPFWNSNLKSEAAWERAKRVCPGMDQGTHYTVVEIRVAREKFAI